MFHVPMPFVYVGYSFRLTSKSFFFFWHEHLCHWEWFRLWRGSIARNFVVFICFYLLEIVLVSFSFRFLWYSVNLKGSSFLELGHVVCLLSLVWDLIHCFLGKLCMFFLSLMLLMCVYVCVCWEFYYMLLHYLIDFGLCILFWMWPFQSASTLENIDEWKWKLSMLVRNKNEQEIVSKEKKDRRDYEQLDALASRMGLYRYAVCLLRICTFCYLMFAFWNKVDEIGSRQYSKVVAVSKVPLPNYRPDLDDKRPQREVISCNLSAPCVSILYDESTRHCDALTVSVSWTMLEPSLK